MNEIIFNNFIKIANKYNESCQTLLTNELNNESMIDPNEISKTFSEIFVKIFDKPEIVLKYQKQYINHQLDIISNILDRFYKHSTESAIHKPNPRDNRFKDESWNNSPTFDYIKQSYLMTSSWFRSLVEETGIADESKKVNFFTSQIIDAMAPTNFVITNPNVLKETIQTDGNNLLRGFENLIKDLEQSRGRLKIRSYNEEDFAIGKNLACTKGKVIFQNDLIQLIHYKPTKARIYSVPMLIIPPWINKFYILDLKPENSFIKWMLDSHYDVYLISWINPNKDHAHKNFEDYMLEGPIEAIKQIKFDCGAKKVNLMGYCIGGTLLACTLSYLKSLKKDWVNSATFLTTLLDFENAGDLSLLMGEEQIKKLESAIEKKGYFDGKDMSFVFDLLKANDMIWSFYINNYLLGKDPVSFDILYWNSDNTRLPASMNMFYLYNMYYKNILKEKDGIMLAKKKINLRSIDVPSYFLSTIEDHIAPWKSTFSGIKLFSGKVDFVLAGSGHVAGVVNHPSKNKHCYWSTPTTKKSQSPDGWFNSSTKQDGSWWLHWNIWNANKSGELQAAKPFSSLKLKPIENAPGTYVKIRY